MTLNRFLPCCGLAALITLAAVAADAPPVPKPKTATPKPDPHLVQATDVKPIAIDGEHNGFPVMTRWKGQLWIAYRRATAHVGTGDLILLRSTDGEKWNEVKKFDMGNDDRNCQLLATPDRLFIYHAVSRKRTDYQTYVSHTDDGEKWSEPQECLETQFNLWKPFEHKGRFYANSHLKLDSSSSGPKRMSRLMTSTDGLKWEQVSIVRQGNWESETTFIFGENEHLYALLRQKYGTMTGFILESDPPYQTWVEKAVGVHFSGHAVREFRGVTYVFSRHYGQQNRPSTMIYTWDKGTLTPYAQTPLNPPRGDCGYCEAVEMGDDMLICFYSSHEGNPKIYTARVPLKKS